MIMSKLQRNSAGRTQENATILMNVFAVTFMISSCMLLRQTIRMEETIFPVEGHANNLLRQQHEWLVSKEQTSEHKDVYLAAETEQYFMDNAASAELAFDQLQAGVCSIWHNETGPEYMHEKLHHYLHELEDYNKRLDKFEPTYSNLRDTIRKHHDADSGLTKDTICNTVRLHLDGHDAIFSSGQLSTSPTGYIEPLLPPLRHPLFCFEDRKNLLNMRYLVHDFESICRALKPHSRTILIDMGASLDFHQTTVQKSDSPALYLIELFRRFGIPFDHIYAYEVTPAEPSRVFELVPDGLLSAFHWINTGVSADPDNRMNPWKMLLESFNEDDLVIVKMDIDTPSIELPLTNQLLLDPKLHKVVDHFYFEHHVSMGEVLPWWKAKVEGSVEDSFKLFHGLREKGIAAHSWV